MLSRTMLNYLESEYVSSQAWSSKEPAGRLSDVKNLAENQGHSFLINGWRECIENGGRPE